MADNADSVLHRLAAAYGIQARWRDVWGNNRDVGVGTLRALLAAQGVAAGGEGEAAASLAELLSRSLYRGLPPLLTADAGQLLEFELGLPASRATKRLTWTLTLPDASRRSGASDPHVLGSDHGRCRCRFAVPMPAQFGYARIMLEDGALGEAAVAIAPAACAVPPDRRSWGLVAPVHAVRAAGDRGLGQFGTLADLAESSGVVGAAALAISPVHALFAADPSHFSPYSPSNRRYFNAFLCDPAGVPGLDDDLVPALERVGPGAIEADWEAAALIDYETVVPARMRLLRLLFDAFAARHLDAAPTRLGADFAAFRAAEGAALEDHARFEALHAHFFGRDKSAWNWRDWPQAYRSPRSPEVDAFARAHAPAASFHVFLQWLADRQLGETQRRARDAGMGIGLIVDLAVGTHSGGSRAWAEPNVLMSGVTIGAPPDVFSPQGQGWGLTAFSPSGLAAQGFAAFRADLAAAMRHAGGIRLDHIMGLSRLWCIPDGVPPAEGAYVGMPCNDMARVATLESRLNDCLVIGEDLGTVPEGFREGLERRRLLGIRVLWFEQDGNGEFTAPEDYSAAAVATITTHDLPSAAGWWVGRDIDWRAKLGLLGGMREGELRAQRARDCASLWSALLRRGLVAAATPPDALDEATAAALAAFLGSSPSPLVLLQIEDALMQVEQPNLPGTTVEHPNWRRRLPADTAGSIARRPAAAITGALSAARAGQAKP